MYYEIHIMRFILNGNVGMYVRSSSNYNMYTIKWRQKKLLR